MKRKIKVLFAGGGTGGHVSPALAICDILKKSHPDWDFAFVGRRGGKENDAITREGKRLYTLEVKGISRSLSIKNIRAVILARKAERECESIFRDFNPDIVIGTGGYVCWPVLHRAIKRGIPTVIHESNAVPGLVTKLLEKKVNCILLNYSEAELHLKKAKRVVSVGNPIRSGFEGITRREARARLGIRSSDLLIVSFGGSLGARKFNEVIPRVMREYSAKHPEIKHIHATGRDFYQDTLKNYPDVIASEGCTIIPYINDMPVYLKAADIAITRSGAMTVSELAAASVASILVPSPNVTANHQYENARRIAEMGGAILLPEDEFNTESLIRHLSHLRASGAKRSDMRMRISEHINSDCQGLILKIIDGYVHGGEK